MPVHGDELKIFTTDGCSAFPDGTIGQKSLWVNCCIRHDLAYWKGGSYDERLAADQALKACVSRVGEPEIANLMLAGVRVGGSPFYPMPYRWGYGWSYLRGYKPLSQQEKVQVKQKLEMLEIMIRSISSELKINEEPE
ncbi:MAG: hypothetical protein OQL16_01620 [Gammaproteobacteria bacterium]|nr:hypothetical protein [Gammaproteobacteria bacterium]